MNRKNRWIDRWRNDYNFRTITAASGSLAVTVIFALYNGFLGIRHSSLWYGTICVYYIVLVILRGMILFASKKYPLRDERENGRKRAWVYAAASALLLLLNMTMIVPVSIMVRQQKPVNLTLVPAIIMAAYTTYKIVMASVNLGKRKRSSDDLVRLLRTISFTDALMSILTLQNTLIMVNANGEDMGMLPLTACTSAAVLLAILLLSAVAIIKGIRGVRGGDERRDLYLKIFEGAGSFCETGAAGGRA